MYVDYEHFTNLEYKVRTLERQVTAFKSGDKYKKLREKHKAEDAKQNREIRNLKKALGKAESEIVRMRKNWEDVHDDISAEHERELLERDREIERYKARALNVSDYYEYSSVSRSK